MVFENFQPKTEALEERLARLAELYELDVRGFLNDVVVHAAEFGVCAPTLKPYRDILRILGRPVVIAGEVLAEIRTTYLRLGERLVVDLEQCALRVVDMEYPDYNSTQRDNQMVLFLIQRAGAHEIYLNVKQAEQMLWQLVRKPEADQPTIAARNGDTLWPLWEKLANDPVFIDALATYARRQISIVVPSAITIVHN